MRYNMPVNGTLITRRKKRWHGLHCPGICITARAAIGSAEDVRVAKRAMICVGGGSMKKFGFLGQGGFLSEGSGHGSGAVRRHRTGPFRRDGHGRRESHAEEFQPDWIVAMGGGSPIDAAKAMWIKYEYPETTFEDMCKVFGLPELRKKAHFCAISFHVRHGDGSDRVLHHHRLRRRGSNIRSRTLKLRPTWRSWIPTLRKRCLQKLAAHTGMDAIDARGRGICFHLQLRLYRPARHLRGRR